MDEMRDSMDLFENEFESNFARSGEEEWEKLFATLDANGDGQISYSEFLTGATDMTRLINKENLRVAFDLLDLDGDGRISTDEISQRFAHSNFKGQSLGLSHGENKGEGYWAKMIHEFDKDGDGFITFEEFYDNMYELLTQALLRRSTVASSVGQDSYIDSVVEGEGE